jgi:hypothetical protein
MNTDLMSFAYATSREGGLPPSHELNPPEPGPWLSPSFIQTKTANHSFCTVLSLNNYFSTVLQKLPTSFSTVLESFCLEKDCQPCWI